MSDEKDASALGDFPPYYLYGQNQHVKALLTSKDEEAITKLLATKNAEVLRTFIRISFSDPKLFISCPTASLLTAFRGNEKSFFIREVATEADRKQAQEEAEKRGFHSYTHITIGDKQYHIYDIKYNFEICLAPESAPRVLKQKDNLPQSEEEKNEQPKVAPANS